jgi:hypothetical protein
MFEGVEMQQKEKKVPSTIAGSGSRHMGLERELLAKRQMLEQDAKKIFDDLDTLFQQVIESDIWQKAHQKYDELDIISQQIKETTAKIEEQREKQIKEQGQ